MPDILHLSDKGSDINYKDDDYINIYTNFILFSYFKALFKKLTVSNTLEVRLSHK